MHPCLNIDEILVAVCSHLDSKQTLLSLALTCTQFKEPALAMLWRRLSNLLPFLALLPKDAVNYQPKYHHFDLERPLSPADWLAAIPYAPYVRDLSVDVEDSRVPSYVAQSYPGIIFPRLQTLRILFWKDPCAPFLKLLLSPCLTHLLLHTSCIRSRDLITTLSDLGVACPSMVSFFCYYHGEYDGATPSILGGGLTKAITHWTELKQLNVPVLTATAIEHLSHLTRLESLTLQRDITSSPAYPGFSSGFACLHTLSTFNRPLAYIVDFLRTSETSVLERIEIALPNVDSGTAKQWKDLFQISAQRSSSTKMLTLIVINDRTVISDNNITFVVKANALRPLIANRQLAELTLPQSYHLELDDSFIEELAKASPNLVRIIIGIARADIGRRPTLTLRSYLHLFTHCTELKELGLVVDKSNDLQSLDRLLDETQFYQHGSEFCLHIGISCTQDTRVAFFLSAFFCELPGIQLYKDCADEILLRGTRVECQLSDFIEMRKHKRKTGGDIRLPLTEAWS